MAKSSPSHNAAPFQLHGPGRGVFCSVGVCGCLCWQRTPAGGRIRSRPGQRCRKGPAAVRVLWHCRTYPEKINNGSLWHAGGVSRAMAGCCGRFCLCCSRLRLAAPRIRRRLAEFTNLSLRGLRVGPWLLASHILIASHGTLQARGLCGELNQ